MKDLQEQALVADKLLNWWKENGVTPGDAVEPMVIAIAAILATIEDEEGFGTAVVYVLEFFHERLQALRAAQAMPDPGQWKQ